MDRLAGLAPGTALQPLAQAHQGDHGGGRLEIQRPGAAGGEVPHAQPESGAGAERDQRVHGAGAGLQRLPRATVEARAEHGLDQGGKRELGPAGKGRVDPERHQQHRRQQRDRGGTGERRLQAVAPGCLRPCAAGRSVVARCWRGTVVSGPAQGLLQRLRGGRFGQPADPRASGREVHRGGGHAGHGEQRPLHPAGTGGTAHPGDRQVHRVLGGGVAGGA